MFNGIYSPYGQSYGQTTNPFNMTNNFSLSQQQVVTVKGEGGARAYQLGANSSALLLDENGLLAWLVTTDGAGYKSVYPYDITPHQEAPAPDYNELNTRMTKIEHELEALINELTGNPTTTTKQSSNSTSASKSNTNK